ncbi:unnamed protein product [Musa banksii]
MWGPHDVTFDQTTRYEWVRVNGYYQVPLNPLPFICHLIPSGTAASIDRLFDGARPARRRLVALVDSFGGMEGAKAQMGSLESSLLQIVQEHQQRSIWTREQTDKAKKNALRTAMRVSELLVDTVNGGVEESFINEKRVELEIRALASTIMRYKKQTDQWLAASHALNTVIKEIGDFENWMKIMDFDCKSINAAIRNIHQM